MTLEFRTGAVCALLAASASAQTVLHEQTHDMTAMQVSLPLHDVDPSSGMPGNYEYVAMFPKEDHVGWGFDSSDPSVHHIAGVRMLIGDTQGATSNPFNIWVHTENPAAPGQPDVATSVGFNANSPIGTPGPGAFLFDVVFPAPVTMPNNADVFISVELLPESNSDSLSILTLAPEDVSAIGSTVWDIGNARTSETGHGAGATGGYGYFIDWSAAQMFFELGQYAIAPLAAQAGFATGATTNQASLTASNPGGTPGYHTGFFSGRQPSLVTDRLGAIRSDEPVLLYQNGNLLNSELVAFLMGQVGAPVALDAILPGSTGTLCLDLAGSIAQINGPGLFLDPNGSAAFSVTIPPAGRGGLIGLDFAFTGIALDFGSASAHASSCGVLRF